jgi:prepilin-type N-terminal cleavage/methylation domain-containing protein
VVSKRRSSPRGFTLVEALLVVIVLAIAVPASTVFLDQRAAQRSDAATAARATVYAQAIMEFVLADAASGHAALGYEAFADASTYLNDPATGMRARFAHVAAPYEALGYTFDVAVGAEVSASGVATGDASKDLFREVTVTVQAPGLAAEEMTIALSALVTDL